MSGARAQGECRLRMNNFLMVETPDSIMHRQQHSLPKVMMKMLLLLLLVVLLLTVLKVAPPLFATQLLV